MGKRVWLGFLLAPVLAFAQTTNTVNDPGWILNSAGTPYTTQALCVAAAEALPVPKPGTSATQKCADTTSVTVSTALPSASPAGAYLTGPTATSALTDAAGTAWMLTAGVVYEQPISAAAPVKAGSTANVRTLLWFGGKIHQQNTACLWWNWSGSTWTGEPSGPGTTGVPPCGNVSPSGTVITGAGQSIVDAGNNTWTIATGIVYEQPPNGVTAPAGVSANVIAVAYAGGKIYQENASCQWFGWTATAVPPWAAVAAPAVTGPVCPPSSSSSSSSGGSSSSSSSSGSSSGSSSSGSSTSSSSSSSGSAAVFGVKASGAKLVSTLNGAQVQLIGMNVSGCETAPLARCAVIAAAGPTFWGTTFKAAHAGTNTLRLPVDATRWSTALYQQQIAKTVADATSAGLYVIIDLHWSAPNGQQSIGQPGYPDTDHVPAFWKAVADTFKNNPAVIFELFNEPYGNNVGSLCCTVNAQSSLLVNGGSETPFVHLNNAGNNGPVSVNITYQVAGELALLQIIRGEAATNLVLGGTYWWNGEIELWPTLWNIAAGNPDPQKNFAAVMHCYGYAKGTGNLSNVLNAGYPLVITEFTQGTDIGNCGGAAFAAANDIGTISWDPNSWNGSSISLNPTGW